LIVKAMKAANVSACAISVKLMSMSSLAGAAQSPAL
jgi:hypothetical protein